MPIFVLSIISLNLLIAYFYFFQSQERISNYRKFKPEYINLLFALFRFVLFIFMSLMFSAFISWFIYLFSGLFLNLTIPYQFILITVYFLFWLTQGLFPKSPVYRSQYGDDVLRQLRKENFHIINSSNISLVFALFGLGGINPAISSSSLIYLALTWAPPSSSCGGGGAHGCR